MKRRIRPTGILDTVALALLFALHAAPASAQPKSSIAEYNASAPTPFGLRFGTTTKQEARALLEREGARIVGEAYLEAKPHAARDEDPEGVPNERGVLIGVAGLLADRVQTSRLGFFDDRLYLLRYVFKPIDGEKLRRELAELYGTSGKEQGYLPSQKTITWRRGQVSIVLKPGFMEPMTLTYVHDPTMERVLISSDQVYAAHIKRSAAKQKGF